MQGELVHYDSSIQKLPFGIFLLVFQGDVSPCCVQTLRIHLEQLALDYVPPLGTTRRCIGPSWNCFSPILCGLLSWILCELSEKDLPRELKY